MAAFDREGLLLLPLSTKTVVFKTCFDATESGGFDRRLAEQRMKLAQSTTCLLKHCSPSLASCSCSSCEKPLHRQKEKQLFWWEWDREEGTQEGLSGSWPPMANVLTAN